MTSGFLDRVQHAFFEIAALPADARPAALEALSDPQLRAGLLEIDQVPDAFLGEPAMGKGFSMAASAEVAEPDLIGKTIGRYRVERLIARGGMGEVYLAIRADGELTFQAALKVVKRGMDTDEVLRRFRAERQTLADLSHPNIGRLLDGGATADGRPYLVMEYVEGLPIDAYCRSQKLTIRERLSLFIRVCSAVHYAHQNLVIHRDLKPSNILVLPDGTPKLLDFGIAKLLTEPAGAVAARATRPEERRLTPEYASPEEIEGRPVTTASDIYSLGVILFEILTGRTPYELATRTTAELVRVICRQPPPAPSTAVGSEPPPADKAGRSPPEDGRRLRRLLRGDLDNIVLMALRKEPERRYATVEQFARDIERSMRGLPVMARRDTFTYRATKFVRRNALLTTGAAVAVIALASLTAIAHWNAAEAARQRDAAFLARDQAEEITEFLRTVLASADPALSGPDLTVADALTSAIKRLETDLRDQPLIQAAVRSAIGTAYVGLGDYKTARTHLEQAYQHRLALLEPGHHDVAESRFELGVLEYHVGRYAESEEHLRAALATFTRIRGENNPDVARMLSSLGAVLRSAGRLDEAGEAHRRALAIRIALNGEDSLAVAESFNNLAGVQRQQNDIAGAIESMERAVAIRRARLGDHHALVAQSIGNLAVMVHITGDLVRAEALYLESGDILDRTLSPTHPAHSTHLNNYSALLRSRGDVAGAAALLGEALRIRQMTLPPGDPRTIGTALALSQCLILLNQSDEAEQILRSADATLETHSPGAAEVRALLAELRASRTAPDSRTSDSADAPSHPPRDR
jgi:eukaryotic-like serine/threonine-protein kinase